MKNVNKVEVFYRNRKVGTLKDDPNYNRTYFSYDDNWLSEGFSIAPFHLPLKPGLFVAEKPYLFFLHGVFFDSLPDSWGRLLMDRYLQSQEINPNTITPLTRLTLLNSTRLGGLEYRPTQGEEPIHEADLDYDKLEESYLGLIDGQQIEPSILADAFSRGSSAGGSRPKLHVAFKDGLYIVKFPAPHDGLSIGKMEYDYMKAAEECGIKVSPYKLIPSNKCEGYFACKRFDRDEKGNPIHRISLAGLCETNVDYPQVDYLTLLQIVQKLCVEDLPQAFALMCFNLFSGNFDDHAQNFSFLYDEANHTYRLSPAYDLTTIPGGKYHQLGFMWKDFPTKEDLFILGERFGLKRTQMKQIIDRVLSVVSKRLSGYYDFLKRKDGASFQ